MYGVSYARTAQMEDIGILVIGISSTLAFLPVAFRVVAYLYNGILSVGLLPVALCILVLQSMAFFSRGVSSVVFCPEIDTLSAYSYWALHTLNFVSILVMKILISAKSVFEIFFSFHVITINPSHWCYYSVYLCNQTSPRECIQNSHRQSRICDI